jgi:hypothetical protein
MSSQSGVHAADRPYLYLAEFLHRVHNEYTCAISLVNRLAARSARRNHQPWTDLNLERHDIPTLTFLTVEGLGRPLQILQA